MRSMSNQPLKPPTCSACLRVLLTLAIALSLPACGTQPRSMQTRRVRVDGNTYRVVTLHLHRDKLRLYWRNPDTGQAFGDIEALRSWGRAHGRRLLFAANAGIYDRRNAPLGLYVENGKTLVRLNTAHGDPRAGNFSLRPNGVFAIDSHGQAKVETTSAYAAQHPEVRWATQSGPMLVIDDHINANFHPHSDSLKWRSGVCARHGDQVLFVVSSTPVNFYSFAHVFRDRLGCRDALYLDGSISQLYVDGTYYGAPSLMVRPYAGIFGVFSGPAAATSSSAPAHSAKTP